jgi:hypothetical protein
VYTQVSCRRLHTLARVATPLTANAVDDAFVIAIAIHAGPPLLAIIGETFAWVGACWMGSVGRVAVSEGLWLFLNPLTFGACPLHALPNLLLAVCCSPHPRFETPDPGVATVVFAGQALHSLPL